MASTMTTSLSAVFNRNSAVFRRYRPFSAVFVVVFDGHCMLKLGYASALRLPGSRSAGGGLDYSRRTRSDPESAGARSHHAYRTHLDCRRGSPTFLWFILWDRKADLAGLLVVGSTFRCFGADAGAGAGARARAVGGVARQRSEWLTSASPPPLVLSVYKL